MTDSSRPSSPLAILTLDGGGLQAVSTLLILNRVLEKIAEENGHPGVGKPKPCDVFDTIAGIGVGGWLAILLGRFRMDITTCLTEWYHMMQRIGPRSLTEAIRLRLFHHRQFDTTCLVKQVDERIQVHRTGDYLFEDDPQGARTRHVFVAALASDTGGYSLFRSYKIPASAKLPEKLLEGPEDPDSFKISHAFAVTGAAKYFTAPWEEQMASSGKTIFNDTKFPEPHNITKLALNEMYGIYGTDVPLSVVVNIGPGLPNDADVQHITRRLPWMPSSRPAHETTPMNEARSPVVLSPQSDSMDQEPSGHSSDDTAECDPTTGPVMKGERNHSVARMSKVGSTNARGIDANLKRLQDDIDSGIKKMLDDAHPGSADLYHRLAPGIAPRGTIQDDSCASAVILDATQGFLDEPRVNATVSKLAKQMVNSVSSC